MSLTSYRAAPPRDLVRAGRYPVRGERQGLSFLAVQYRLCGGIAQGGRLAISSSAGEFFPQRDTVHFRLAGEEGRLAVEVREKAPSALSSRASCISRYVNFFESRASSHSARTVSRWASGGDADSACSQSARGRCEGRMTGPVQTATAFSSLPCAVMIRARCCRWRGVPRASRGAGQLQGQYGTWFPKCPCRR